MQRPDYQRPFKPPYNHVFRNSQTLSAAIRPDNKPSLPKGHLAQTLELYWNLLAPVCVCIRSQGRHHQQTTCAVQTSTTCIHHYCLRLAKQSYSTCGAVAAMGTTQHVDTRWSAANRWRLPSTDSPVHFSAAARTRPIQPSKVRLLPWF